MRNLLLPAVVLAAAFTQDRGPKVADVRGPAGDVAVARGEERLGVRAVGRRVVNGDVYDSDRIETADGASCDVIFADDSRVSLEAGTQIRIEQRRLREPTDAGRSIGRRISILAGHVSSDIIPSADVQTDFVTPAGTAAVRGTLVDIGVAGPSADVFFDVGHGRFTGPNGQSAFGMPAGSHLGISVADDGSLDVRNLGPDPLVGQLGDTALQVGVGARVRAAADADGYRIEEVDGDVTLMDDQGAWAPAEAGDECAYSDSPLTDETASMVDPAEGGAAPAPAADSDTLGAPTGAFETDAAAIANSLATASGFLFIDDFSRGDGTDIGNGWIENISNPSGPDWTILAGEATVTLDVFDGFEGGPDSSNLVRDVGHLSTFRMQVTAWYNPLPADIEFRMAGNHDPIINGGLLLVYNTTGTMELKDGTDTVIASSSAPSTLPDEPFTMRLTFDGSSLTGELIRNGVVDGQLTGVVGVDSGGSIFGFGANNQEALTHTVHFDDFRLEP